MRTFPWTNLAEALNSWSMRLHGVWASLFVCQSRSENQRAAKGRGRTLSKDRDVWIERWTYLQWELKTADGNDSRICNEDLQVVLYSYYDFWWYCLYYCHIVLFHISMSTFIFYCMYYGVQYQELPKILGSLHRYTVGYTEHENKP